MTTATLRASVGAHPIGDRTALLPLIERPRSLLADPPSDLGLAAVRNLSERSHGGGLTLGQKLDRVWEDLHAAGAAECPVCQAHMTAGATPACSACGTRLS